MVQRTTKQNKNTQHQHRTKQHTKIQQVNVEENGEETNRKSNKHRTPTTNKRKNEATILKRKGISEGGIPGRGIF